MRRDHHGEDFPWRWFRQQHITVHVSLRSIPNRLLAQGFGINNCFTISEFGTCASFRSNVVSMLSMPKDKWSNIAGLARKVAQDEVADQSSALNLSTVVQKLTMKTMFMPLFDRDTHSPEHDSNIRDLAESINQQ